MEKKKKKIIYSLCFLKIKITGSNVFGTVTDYDGSVISKISAGIDNFSGKKKGTSYVACKVIKRLLLELENKEFQIKMLICECYGFTKEFSLISISKMIKTIKINNIIGVYNPLKYGHNGRPLKKERRL